MNKLTMSHSDQNSSHRNGPDSAARGPLVKPLLVVLAALFAGSVVGLGAWLADSQSKPPAVQPLDPVQTTAADPVEQEPAEPGFEPTIFNLTHPPGESPEGMVWIPGG